MSGSNATVVPLPGLLVGTSHVNLTPADGGSALRMLTCGGTYGHYAAPVADTLELAFRGFLRGDASVLAEAG